MDDICIWHGHDFLNWILNYVKLQILRNIMKPTMFSYPMITQVLDLSKMTCSNTKRTMELELFMEVKDGQCTHRIWRFWYLLWHCFLAYILNGNFRIQQMEDSEMAIDILTFSVCCSWVLFAKQKNRVLANKKSFWWTQSKVKYRSFHEISHPAIFGIPHLWKFPDYL